MRRSNGAGGSVLAALGHGAAVQAACSALEAIEPWLQEQQLAVTAVPAPTGYEGLRAEWFLRQCQAWGLTAAIDEAGNVVAERPGSESQAPALAVTAHLDTAFPPGTPVRVERRRGRLFGPGIADNGAGLTALLAFMRVLRERRLTTLRPLVFVANVGEEGEGDLRGMRHLFRPGGPWSERIGATLVLDGPGSEAITVEALPSRRLKLVFEAPGGHSWSDLGRASAVHAAARTAAALLAQVRPRTGVSGCNLGVMQGGGAVNAIAAEAFIKVDLRARDAAGIEEMTQAVRRALAIGLEQEHAAALSGEVRGRIEAIGERPGGRLAADSPLLGLVQRVDAALGIASRPQCGSTDANLLLAQGREALRLGAGGAGGGIHTVREWFDPAGRGLGLRRVLLTALAWAGIAPARGVEAPLRGSLPVGARRA